MKRSCWFTVGLTLWSLPVGGASIEVGVPESGIELGMGWDTQRAETIRNRCVRFAPVREDGQQISLEMSDVSDTSELMERLKVSASMSVKSLVGSASAQAEFASRSKVNRTTNTLLIRATVNNGVLFAGPSRPQQPSRFAFPSPQGPSELDPTAWEGTTDQLELTEFARDLLGAGGGSNVREFERHCGDSFVSAIFSGAELLATLSFSSTDSNTNRDAKSAVKGELSGFGVKGEAEAQGEGERNQLPQEREHRGAIHADRRLRRDHPDQQGGLHREVARAAARSSAGAELSHDERHSLHRPSRLAS